MRKAPGRRDLSRVCCRPVVRGIVSAGVPLERYEPDPGPNSLVASRPRHLRWFRPTRRLAGSIYHRASPRTGRAEAYTFACHWRRCCGTSNAVHDRTGIFVLYRIRLSLNSGSSNTSLERTHEG